jgi:hypothetical protein
LHQRFHLFKPSTWEWQVRWSEQERAESLIQIDRAYSNLGGAFPGGASDHFGARLINERGMHMAYLSMGSTTTISPPSELMLAPEFQSQPPGATPPRTPKVVSVRDIFPAEITYRTEEATAANPKMVSFVVTGSNLDLLDPDLLSPASEIVHQVAMPAGFMRVHHFDRITADHAVIKASIIASLGPTGGAFSLPLQRQVTAVTGQDRVFTPFVALKPIEPPKAPAPAPPKTTTKNIEINASGEIKETPASAPAASAPAPATTSKIEINAKGTLKESDAPAKSGT